MNTPTYRLVSKFKVLAWSLCFCAMTSARSGRSGPIVLDQYNLGDFEGWTFIGTTGQQPLHDCRQTFQAGVSGRLARIELNFEPIGVFGQQWPTEDLLVDIIPHAPVTSVEVPVELEDSVAHLVVPADSFSDTVGLVSVSLDSMSVSMVASRHYSLILRSADTIGAYVSRVTSGDAYPAGISFYRSTGLNDAWVPSITPGLDLGFATYVELTPEPATAATGMLGIAWIGLLYRSRKFAAGERGR